MTRPITFAEGKPVDLPVVVGFGGNLGNPQQAFRKALGELGTRVPIHAVSRLYRSAPWGPPQPDFLNAAVLVDFSGALGQLLVLLQELEHAAGRTRTIRWGPRTLDLDILWADDRTESSSTLTVPHPALTQRAFALFPLLDVCPEARDPQSGALYSRFAEALEQSSCNSVEGVNWWEAVSDN